MADLSPEQTETTYDWQNLSFVDKNNEGEYLNPVSINIGNLYARVRGDMNAFTDKYNKTNKKRDVLSIEKIEIKSLHEMSTKIDEMYFNWRLNRHLSINDVKLIGKYLEWSYQQQVGTPANLSNINEARKHGVGAEDAWTAMNYIKNKLNE